eukprot:scaffold73_cov252-Pinguiococcus_pyrenoidosus.AAC.8
MTARSADPQKASAASVLADFPCHSMPGFVVWKVNRRRPKGSCRGHVPSKKRRGSNACNACLLCSPCSIAADTWRNPFGPNPIRRPQVPYLRRPAQRGRMAPSTRAQQLVLRSSCDRSRAPEQALSHPARDLPQKIRRRRRAWPESSADCHCCSADLDAHDDLGAQGDHGHAPEDLGEARERAEPQIVAGKRRQHGGSRHLQGPMGDPPPRIEGQSAAPAAAHRRAGVCRGRGDDAV